MVIEQVIECDIDRSELAPNRRTQISRGWDPRRQQRVVFADEHAVLDPFFAVIHFWQDGEKRKRAKFLKKASFGVQQQLS